MKKYKRKKKGKITPKNLKNVKKNKKTNKQKSRFIKKKWWCTKISILFLAC